MCFYRPMPPRCCNSYYRPMPMMFSFNYHRPPMFNMGCCFNPMKSMTAGLGFGLGMGATNLLGSIINRFC